MKVKVNDNVLVISGNHKGEKGKVVNVSPKAGTVAIDGITHKKAKKARKANELSQIVDVPAPIDASNVMVICPACDKAIRVKYNVTAGADGKKVKVRVCPKCGAVLESKAQGKGKAPVKTEETPKKRTRKRSKKEEATPEKTGDAE